MSAHKPDVAAVPSEGLEVTTFQAQLMLHSLPHFQRAHCSKAPLVEVPDHLLHRRLDCGPLKRTLTDFQLRAAPHILHCPCA